MLLSVCIQDFLFNQNIKGNSSKTISYYTTVLDIFYRFIGDKDLEELKLIDLQQYYISLSSRGLSSVSVQTYIRGLRAFLQWCYDEDYMSSDLVSEFSLPKCLQPCIDVLTDTEIDILFRQFRMNTILGLRNYCICALMLDCGMRLNEVVTVNKSRLRLLDGYLIAVGKGNKERIVPMGLNTRKYMLKYGHLTDNLKGDFFFRKDNGEPIKISTVNRLFGKLKADTGITRLHPHMLRHTFATRYIENGGNAFVLQQLLGHTSLEMTKKYTHFIGTKAISEFRNYSPLDNISKNRLT